MDTALPSSGSDIFIGFIDPLNPSHFEIMKRISADENVLRHMDDAKMNDKELINFIRGYNDPDTLLVGIFRKENGENILHGWLHAYSPDEFVHSRMQKISIPVPQSHKHLIEISYAKDPLGPPHYMSRGVRATLPILENLFMHHRMRIYERESNFKKTIREIFSKKPKIKKSIGMITAFIDPDKNPQSVNLLMSLGFEDKGVIYYDKEQKELSHVYVWGGKTI